MKTKYAAALLLAAALPACAASRLHLHRQQRAHHLHLHPCAGCQLREKRFRPSGHIFVAAPFSRQLSISANI